MVNYVEAVKRPFQDFKKLSIGAALYVIPLVNIITGFFGAGYAYRCAENQGELPRWKNWSELLQKGFFGLLISLCYAGPLVLLSTVLIYLLGVPSNNLLMAEVPAFPAVRFTMYSVVLVFLPAFIWWYTSSMAIVHYVKHDSFSAGFDLTAVLDMVLTKRYFLAAVSILAYALLLFVLSAVLLSLVAFTIIGPFIVQSFATFILLVTAMTVFGQVYDELDRST